MEPQILLIMRAMLFAVSVTTASALFLPMLADPAKADVHSDSPDPPDDDSR